GGVTTDDRIVLLATCTSEFTNGRHLLVAKLHDTPFPNPFAEEEEAERERTNFIDGQLLPILRTICLPALLVVAFLVMVYWAIQKRRRWSVEDKWALIEANPKLLEKLEKEGLGLKKDPKGKGPDVKKGPTPAPVPTPASIHAAASRGAAPVSSVVHSVSSIIK
ncbi:MAG: hypothetical protein FWC86_06120, partial [Coriobacteriia bacterium]|nr:hypothetical protein [Coriobacteriia bacterium]